jgi:hypothetical protein
VRNKKKEKEQDDYAIVEVFGGAFALLLVLFLFFNLISESISTQRLLDTKESQGKYNINWDNNSQGFVVLSFKNKAHILQTNQIINSADICKKNSPFIDYAHRVYDTGKNQIIIAILEGGVSTMRALRDCLSVIYVGKRISIGWIIANRELLKAVKIGDIPSHIKKVIDK